MYTVHAILYTVLACITVHCTHRWLHTQIGIQRKLARISFLTLLETSSQNPSKLNSTMTSGLLGASKSGKLFSTKPVKLPASESVKLHATESMELHASESVTLHSAANFTLSSNVVPLSGVESVRSFLLFATIFFRVLLSMVCVIFLVASFLLQPVGWKNIWILQTHNNDLFETVGDTKGG